MIVNWGDNSVCHHNNRADSIRHFLCSDLLALTQIPKRFVKIQFPKLGDIIRAKPFQSLRSFVPVGMSTFKAGLERKPL